MGAVGRVGYYSSPSFLRVDVDPFGDYDKPDETGKTIPLNPGGVVVEGGSTWEPEYKRETSFRGGKTQRTRLKEAQVEGLYQKLSKIICQTPKYYISVILHLEMENCTTKTKARLGWWRWQTRESEKMDKKYL